jgi:hypothetical protein
VHEPVVYKDGKLSERKRSDTNRSGAGQKNVAHRAIVHVNRTHPIEADGRVEWSQGQDNQESEPIERSESITAGRRNGRHCLLRD